MSTSAITSALSGLQLAQKGLDLTATNIANAQTDGYTRKTLPQESIVIGNNGVGVRSGEIQRFVDQSLMRDYRTQIGVEAGLTVRESYLSRIQSFHGSSDQATNISAKLAGLANSFTTLSATPDSATARQAVVDQATNFASGVNKYANFLLQLRTETNGAIGDEVKTINTTLSSIADYNKRIQQMKFVGSSTATLEDQRDVQLKALSQSLDISYFEDGNGALVVQTKSGQPLADTTARQFNFDANGMTYASSYPDSLSGVVVNDATGSFDLAKSAGQTGGRLGSLLALRDQDLPSYMGQIDELAQKVAQRFDEQGVRLFTDTAGAVPANTQNQYVGFAQTIQVNKNVANDASLVQSGTTGAYVDPASTTILDKVINYTFGKTKDAAGTPQDPFNLTNNGPGGTVSFAGLVNGNASLDEYTRSMLGQQAQTYSDTNTQLTTEKSYTQEVQKRLLDGSSVNTDEEMAKLIDLQKNYTASAKMITTLNDLFKELMNVLG